MFVIDFQPDVKDPRAAGMWFYINISVTDKYMSSQVRAGWFKGVENRGVADMARWRIPKVRRSTNCKVKCRGKN